jgi:hypothetical protein
VRVSAKHVSEHVPTTMLASGYRCVAPSGRSAAALGPSRRLPMHLPRHARLLCSHCCIDSRLAATPPLRGVASLHAVIFAVPAHRRPRRSSHRLPWRGSPRPCKVFIKPSGSSSSTLSIAAAPLRVTCMATFGHRHSRHLHHHLRPLRLRRQRHRLILDHVYSDNHERHRHLSSPL